MTLTIYTANGQKVKTLKQENRGRGIDTVIWDKRNDAGELVASGIYTAVLEIKGKKIERLTAKVPVIK